MSFSFFFRQVRRETPRDKTGDFHHFGGDTPRRNSTTHTFHIQFNPFVHHNVSVSSEQGNIQ